MQICDETLGGQIVGQWVLEAATETMTVRELIRSRVYQEVQDYNLKQQDAGAEFRGLVQPADAERTSNPFGYKMKARRSIDWEAQFAKALEAFERQQVLILVNERQVESLDEQIVVAPETRVSFLRLTLLVGG